MTTEMPPTLGLVLAGGLARRMGGGDKALIRIGGETILERALARLAPQVERHRAQRQWRSGALCVIRLAGRRRQRAGFRRTARRHSRGARLGRRRTGPDIEWSSACRAIARSCRAIWWRGCTRARVAKASRSPARIRATGVIRWSACGRSRCARICATPSRSRTCARSRCGPRATASRSPTGRPSRSIRSSM